MPKLFDQRGDVPNSVRLCLAKEVPEQAGFRFLRPQACLLP
jgi:hypothetical protein